MTLAHYPRVEVSGRVLESGGSTCPAGIRLKLKPQRLVDSILFASSLLLNQ